MKDEKEQKLLKGLAIAGAVSLVMFIPQVRELIIWFGEKYVGRPLTHEVWHGRFVRWEMQILSIILIGIVYLLPEKRYKSFSKIDALLKCRAVPWMMSSLLPSV